MRLTQNQNKTLDWLLPSVAVCCFAAALWLTLLLIFTSLTA